jgi:D-lactate dehydrogenase (cytochrome)
MDRIRAIHGEDLDATVEAGVTRKQLNRHLHEQGLFFPVDPGADASFGGMAATRASGTNAVRYGTMRENVLALEVVLASGEVIRTGRRARKSSAGYDLTRLFVGSEGTLGVITEVTVRLQGLPEAMAAGVVSFEAVRPAVETAIHTIQAGIPVARVELLDAAMMRAVNQHSGTDYAPQPTLFVEFHGSPAGVEEQAREMGEIAQANGGTDFHWEREAEARERLWHARHHAYYAALSLRPGARVVSTDVCVPISRLADCIDETRQDLEASFIEAPLVGHVGDGNFHLLMVIDLDSDEEVAEAERLHDRLVHRALAMEGTCTGEHGVGLGKRKFLVAEHGTAAVEAMRALKRALDPENLFNPGKIF